MSVRKICSTEGCDRPVFAKGHCRYHYDKLREEGKIKTTFCTVGGCDNPVHGKGLCAKHYRQKARTGSIDYTCSDVGYGSYNKNPRADRE